LLLKLKGFPDWLSFLVSKFKSAEKYTKKLEDFLLWKHSSIQDDTDILARQDFYFKENQELLTASGMKQAPTVFKSWYIS
jgi:hypothetical protein